MIYLKHNKKQITYNYQQNRNSVLFELFYVLYRNNGVLSTN